MKKENDKKMFDEVFKNSEQKMNDQKLEFFTYSSTWKLGCLKVSSSNADKVYHGPAPVILNFKETPAKVSIIEIYYIYRVMWINITVFI